MKKTTRTKRTLKIGNDGYNCKNVTVKAYKDGIVITRTDPHSWGCVSDTIFIRKDDYDVLTSFILDQK